MKLLLQIIITALLTFLFQKFLPWWSAQLCSLMISFFIPNTLARAFWGGFVSIALLWMVCSTIIDAQTKSMLTQKILPQLNLKSTLSLILITGIVGGFVGGCGAVLGQAFRRSIFGK